MNRLLTPLIAAILLSEAHADFTMACYSNSANTYGNTLGTSATDRKTLSTRFSELTETSRSAAIKTCVGNSNGSRNNELLGVQVAVTDYSANAADIPTESELIWLDGLGVNLSSTSIDCETIYIARTAGISQFSVTTDSSGVIAVAYQISTGIVHSYGTTSGSN
jgi:hypothetical protein